MKEKEKIGIINKFLWHALLGIGNWERWYLSISAYWQRCSHL